MPGSSRSTSSRRLRSPRRSSSSPSSSSRDSARGEDSRKKHPFLFRVAPIGGPLLGAGAGLTLILGVILALESDRFEIWNGWIIAALVLWALMGAVGQRTGAYYTNVQKRLESGDPGAEAE